MSALRRRRARQPPAVPSGGSGHSPPGQAQSAWLACTSTRAVAWRLQATSATISSRTCGTGTSTICFPTCDRSLDNRNTTPEQERVSCEIYKGSRPQHVDQVHQTHLQRSPVNKEVQKNPHTKQNQCDCLPRFTRRAFSNPPLLALLPLDDDVLRERPQAACLVIGG